MYLGPHVAQQGYVGMALEGCPLELVPPKPILSTPLLAYGVQLSHSLYPQMPLIFCTSNVKLFNHPIIILIACVMGLK